MKRLALVAIAVILCAAASLVFELITKPIDIDVSHCRTKWRNGRISSVYCPGGVPG